MRNFTSFTNSSLSTGFVFISFGILALLLAPQVTLGAQFVPLAGLPQIAPNAGGGLAGYLNQLYLFLIIVGCIIAAIRISIAGAEYAFTDIVTSKEEAKKHIYGVLTGLAILLLPFLVLNTIYPALTNLDILSSAGALKTTINPTQGTTTQAAIPSGTMIKTCKYDVICPNGTTGTSATCVVQDYDSTGCRAECNELLGVFTETDSMNSKCTYFIDS